MCRLLCVAATTPQNIRAYLHDAEFSLVRQATKGKHKHGWGVGYYQNDTVHTIKQCSTICEKEISTTNDLHSPVFLAHVRKATNPRKLPFHTLLTEANTHPFTYKNYTFAHNGTLKIPDSLEAELGPYKQHLKGQCDSEILFFFILKLIEEHDNVIRAIQHLDAALWKLNTQTKPYNSINFILTDGKNVYAYNKYNTTSKKTAHFSNNAYFAMVYHLENNILIIASEPLFEGQWNSIGNGKILHAHIDTAITIKIASDASTALAAAAPTRLPY